MFARLSSIHIEMWPWQMATALCRHMEQPNFPFEQNVQLFSMNIFRLTDEPCMSVSGQMQNLNIVTEFISPKCDIQDDAIPTLICDILYAQAHVSCLLCFIVYALYADSESGQRHHVRVSHISHVHCAVINK